MSRFQILCAADLMASTSPPWFVQDVLPARGLAALFGPSGSGKSFLMLDLAANMATGTPWFGHFVQRARRVIIIYLEGADGMRRRICSWEKHHQRTFPENVGFLSTSLDLGDRAQVEELSDTIAVEGGADVLFIDTLARAMPGQDENSPSAMGAVIHNSGVLQAALDGLIVLVSHTGKNESAGLRGHSSLHAALDASIQVSRTQRGRSWRLAKSKDGPESIKHDFELHLISDGPQENGQASCVVVPTERLDARLAPVRPRGANQQQAWEVLRGMIDASRLGNVDHEELVSSVAETLAVPSKRRRERAIEAIGGLKASGLIVCIDGKVSLGNAPSRHFPKLSRSSPNARTFAPELPASP